MWSPTSISIKFFSILQGIKMKKSYQIFFISNENFIPASENRIQGRFWTGKQSEKKKNVQMPIEVTCLLHFGWKHYFSLLTCHNSWEKRLGKVFTSQIICL